MTRNKEATVFTQLPDVMRFVDHIGDVRENLPFNTDGLVIKSK